LMASGRMIGTLVLEKQQVSRPVRLTFGVLSPVFIVALFLVFLIVVIGVLLMRRVVNPLSEVIAAAESVAVGKLDTRIKVVKGQNDLNALSVHFNHMTETLERNDAERRGLLADIAHELRTPLSVLRGRMEGMMDGVYPADDTNIAQALEETYLLERLVDDLRLLTLAETRQLHFEKKPTNLVEVLLKTLNIFEPQAKSRNIEISIHSETNSAIVEADPQRLEQVIGNLVSNSMRYVSEGSRIDLSLEKVDKDLIIKVSDNGPGVNEEDLPFIFDRFWRGEKSRARVSGGAGLGLAISRQLIEAQGGTITAANRKEGGLEITISLPEFRG
jgi:two-component system, OmpR family, sensor histidine kinase BaeS